MTSKKRIMLQVTAEPSTRRLVAEFAVAMRTAGLIINNNAYKEAGKYKRQTMELDLNFDFETAFKNIKKAKDEINRHKEQSEQPEGN